MIDLDGTLCVEGNKLDRPLAKPFPGAVEALNKILIDGHIVVIWTGRGWDEYKMTEKWLKDNGFKYTQLLMGKPVANLIIDDRSRHFEGWDKDYLATIHDRHRR